MACES